MKLYFSNLAARVNRIMSSEQSVPCHGANACLSISAIANTIVFLSPRPQDFTNEISEETVGRFSIDRPIEL